MAVCQVGLTREHKLTSGAVTAGWPCRQIGPVLPEPPENLFVFMKSNIEILAAG